MISLIIKSIQLDIQFLIVNIELSKKIKFIFDKYTTLIKLIFTKQSQTIILPNNNKVIVRDISDLGTFQSSILDVYKDLAFIKDIQNPVIFDIGANVGQFANAILTLNPNAKVISFEPDPQVFELLQKNTKNLQNIEGKNVGLSYEFGKLTFYVNKLSLVSSFVKPETGLLKELIVNVDTIDNIAKSYDKIDLLKIDVEGYELDVIKGCITSFEKIKYIIVEMSLGRGNDKPIKFIKLLPEFFGLLRTCRILYNEGIEFCQDFIFENKSK